MTYNVLFLSNLFFLLKTWSALTDSFGYKG